MKKTLLLLTFLLSVPMFAQDIAPDFSRAMAYYNQGDYGRAYEIFKGLGSLNGVDEAIASSSHYYAGESLIKLGQIEGAISQWETFVAKYPWSNYYEEALYKLGTLYFETRQFQKSRDRLKLLIEKYPSGEFVGSSMFFIGESYTREGKLQEAIDFFGDAISSKQNNKYIDNSIFSLAGIYEKTGDYENAVTYYDELLTYYKSSPLAPNAQVRIGLCYFRIKDYDNAILELSDPLIKELPLQNRTEAIYILANSFYRLKEYDNAEKSFTEVLEENPTSPLVREARYGLAWTNFQKGKYEESYKIFDLLSKGGNDSITVNSMFWSGESKRYAGKESEAQLIFNDFMKKYPQSSLIPRIKYLLGVTSYTKNKVSVSEDYLLASAKSDDFLVRARAFTLLGEMSLNQKEYLKARNYFQNSLSTQGIPRDLSNRAVLGLGVAQYYLNQNDAAVSNLSDLLARAKGFESNKVHFYLAESYFGKKDYSNALKQYNQVDAKDKDLTPQVMYGKAYCYFNLKDFANASQFFADYIKKYKNSANLIDAKLRLADSYYGIKKYSEAGRIYKEVFLSNDPRMSSDYAYYQYAQALYKAGNADEAINEFLNLQSRFPNSKYIPESQYIIGWIYFQKGNFHRAVENYYNLVSRFPSSPIIPIAYNGIGNAYFNLGNYDSAIVYYTNVLRDYGRSNYVLDAITGIKDAYIAEGLPEQAVGVIDSYIAENPSAAFADQILFQKGQLYYSLRNYEMAKTSYKQFISAYPKSSFVPEAYYWIGKSASNLKQNEEALYNFNIVYNSYLNSETGVAAVLEMGRIHTELKNYDAAVRVYQAAVDKLPPTSSQIPEIVYSKGMVLLAKGDMSAAYEDFSYVIQYYGNTIFAANAKFEIALLELARKNYETADGLLKEVSENRTDDLGAKAQYYYGVSLFEQGKTDEAISALTRVRFVFGTYDEWLTRSFLKLGECYLAKNEVQNAREVYRTVLQRHRGDKFGNEAQSKLREIQ